MICIAILNNLIVNGTARFLNKLYANDIDIGNDVTISGKTTTTKLHVDTTINNNTNYSVDSNNLPFVVGTITGRHIVMDSDEITAKSGATGQSTLFLNYGGGAVYLSNGGNVTANNGTLQAQVLKALSKLGDTNAYIPNAYITTGTITTINSNSISNSSSIITRDMEVVDTLKSYKWDISHVANLSNDFTVSPTLQLASGAKIKFTAINTSTKVCTFTITDSSSISSDSLGGVTWSQYSKVKFTMNLNNIVNSNCDGYLTVKMNSTAGTMTISGTLDNVTGLNTTTNYNAEGATIMLYEVGAGNQSTTYPVGIRMTAYGSNKRSYIDIYGGTLTSSWNTPHVRIGNVGGLTFNGTTLDNQWGIYTDMGYFSGAIVSTEGKIGGFDIGTTNIRNAVTSLTDTSHTGIYMGTDGIRNYNTSCSKHVTIKDGTITANSVDLTGAIKATSGFIGQNATNGFTISNTAIYNPSTKSTLGSDTIDGVYIGKDGIALGKGKFKVTSAGAVTAGDITATGGTIGGCSIVNGVLQIANANISEAITVGNLDLNIGGRNLFRYTALTDVISNKWIKNGTVSCSMSGDKLTITGAGEVYPTSSYYTPYVVPINTTITLSCYFYENTVSDGNRYIYYAVTPGWRNKRVPANYVGLWQETFTTTEELTVLCPEYDLRNSTGGKWVVSPLKLEIGNKATAWSPAPEDLDVHKYVTEINSDGIWVTPSGKKPSDTSAGTGATGTKISGDGMQIFNAGTKIATFGSYVTIGETGSGKFNTYIDSGGIYMRKAGVVFSEFTGGAIKFYDGSGVTDANVTVNIGSSGGAVFGKTAGKHTILDSDGFRIKSGSTVLSNFGTDVTIGQNTSGRYNVYIGSTGGVENRLYNNTLSKFDSSGIKFYDGNYTAGGANEANYITAQFTSTGAKIGKNNSSNMEILPDSIKIRNNDNLDFFAVDMDGQSRNVNIYTGTYMRDVSDYSGSSYRWVSSLDFSPIELTNGEAFTIEFRVRRSDPDTGRTITTLDECSFNKGTARTYTNTRLDEIIYDGNNTFTFDGSVPSNSYVSWEYKAKVVRQTSTPSYTIGTRGGTKGSFSVALGEGITASGSNQTVIGKYNDEDVDGDYAFVIGNGTDVAPNNALTVDWDGNLECNNIGVVYEATSKNVQITTANIDSFVNGASLGLQAGVYVLNGTWIFQAGASTGTRNLECRITDSSGTIISDGRTRVLMGANNYAILQATAIAELSAGTYYIRGSSSMKTNSAGATFLRALRIR